MGMNDQPNLPGKIAYGILVLVCTHHPGFSFYQESWAQEDSQNVTSLRRRPTLKRIKDDTILKSEDWWNNHSVFPFPCSEPGSLRHQVRNSDSPIGSGKVMCNLVLSAYWLSYFSNIIEVNDITGVTLKLIFWDILSQVFGFFFCFSGAQWLCL